MSEKTPPPSQLSYTDLPKNAEERHAAFVDLFGQWLFWHRNRSLGAAKLLVESEEARAKLGTIRRKSYDRVATMTSDQQDAAISFAKEIVDNFLERLTWSLGDEGVDCRFDDRHAYRFRIDAEIVDVESREIIEEEPVNRKGRFFGKNWGRWLNNNPA
jgi:hypothetical protein